jgi:Holliday junction resolvase RusA-like endonuclease
LQQKIILNITPQTAIRTVQGDRIFFKIPRNKLRKEGLKRLCRIERYNQYKVDLNALAKEKRFIFPHQGAAIHFFIPCPPSWSKKKKAKYHGTIHQSTPDLSNLLKAVEDGLFLQDKHIAHLSGLSKRWVDFETGWIEFHISEPVFQAIEIPQQ